MIKSRPSVYNISRLKYRRKELRHRQTIEEEMLWEELRNNKLGVKFRRQYSVLGYVTDFYCSKYKLAIEVDGSIHKNRIKYDEFRKKSMDLLGIKTIRFWGSQVRSDIKSVLEIIEQHLTPGPSPW